MMGLFSTFYFDQHMIKGKSETIFFLMEYTMHKKYFIRPIENAILSFFIIPKYLSCLTFIIILYSKTSLTPFINDA